MALGCAAQVAPPAMSETLPLRHRSGLTQSQCGGNEINQQADMSEHQQMNIYSSLSSSLPLTSHAPLAALQAPQLVSAKHRQYKRICAF